MAEDVSCKIRIMERVNGTWKDVYCQVKGIDPQSVVYIVERYIGKLFDKEARRKKSLAGGLDKSPIPGEKE